MPTRKLKYRLHQNQPKIIDFRGFSLPSAGTYFNPFRSNNFINKKNKTINKRMANKIKKRGFIVVLFLFVFVMLLIAGCTKGLAKERAINKCSAEQDVLLKDLCLANASINYNDSSICDLLSTETRIKLCKTLPR